MNLSSVHLKRRVVTSISSWFCIPEEGMKDFEVRSPLKYVIFDQ